MASTSPTGPLPTTSGRVERHTAPSVRHRIAADTEARLRQLEQHPDRIPHRLAELDAEWDVERALEANAAALALGGTLLGALHDRRFLVVPAVVSSFLLMHAIEGWCPPLPLLRRLGFRTAGEIGRERAALKAMRGDFERLARTGADERAALALQAAG